MKMRKILTLTTAMAASLIALFLIAMPIRNGHNYKIRSSLENKYIPMEILQRYRVLRYDSFGSVDTRHEWLMGAKSDTVDFSVIEDWVYPMDDNLAGGDRWIISRAEEMAAKIDWFHSDGSPAPAPNFTQSFHKAIDRGVYLDVVFSDADIFYMCISNN